MIINIGITEETSTLEKRRIQLVNFIAIISIVVGTLSEAYTLFHSGFIFISFIPYLLATLLLVAVMYFNSIHQFKLSRIIVVLMSNVSLLFLLIGLDENLRAPEFHLVNYIVYVAIFEKFKSILFWSLITFSIYFLGTYLQVYDILLPVFTPDANLIPMFRFIFLFVTSVLIISITLFFKKVNDDNQEALSLSNEKLQNALKTINTQNLTLQNNVDEKEVLLQEVHHRVKNNLQVIASLIDLQIDKDLEPYSYSVLNECKNRVNAMSLVHEKLYQSDNFEQINLKEYISGLISNISESHVSVHVTTKLTIDNFKLSMDNTIQLGLIINELVTNSYKHAFNINNGELMISLKQKEKDIVLIVKDNGYGLPRNIELDTTDDRKLGIKLVKMLTKQLKGNSQFINDGGLKVTVNFSV